MSEKYVNGQKVVIYDENTRDAIGHTAVVTSAKPGVRTVIAVRDCSSEPEVFWIETGRKVDGDRRAWILTLDEHANHIRRGEMTARIEERGIEFRREGAPFSTSQLERLVALLESFGREDGS